MEEYIPREGKKTTKRIIKNSTGSERHYLRELFKSEYADKYDILRSIGREKNIIIGVFKIRPGIFWTDHCADAREQISKFFEKKNLPYMAENILMHGAKGKSKSHLIVGDPATKAFLDTLENVMKNNKKLTAQFAKLLSKVYV